MSTSLTPSRDPFLYPIKVTPSTRLDPAKDPDPLTVTAAEQHDFHLAPAPKYRLAEKDPRKVRVIHIGSGVSGITFSILSRWRLKNVDVKIYEKNPQLGGTWLENRYPGCRCDVPSHYYSWRFFAHQWTSGYATSPDIWEYFRRVGDVIGFDELCSYSHEVLSATWDEAGAVWRVEVKDLHTGKVESDWCHVLVNGNGPLNRPKLPEIEGLKDFKGEILHTARWPEGKDLRGKRVAAIGCGSSGLQLISGLQPNVKHLDIYMRTPTYITDYSADLILKEEDKQKFRDPMHFRRYLADFWIGGEKRHNLFLPNSRLQERFRKIALAKLEAIKDPVLRAKMTPNYPVGCRRLTPSVEFFDTVQAPNVEMIVGDVIERIVENGIIAEGKLREVDVICCATGFDTTYIPWIKVQGRGGKTLKEIWKDGAQGYKSVMVSGFPNYIATMGPQAPVASNSIHLFIEQQLNYALAIIMELQQGALIVDPKLEAQEAYNKFCYEGLKNYVYHASCGGWYKQKNGLINAHYPGPGNAYMDSIAAPVWEELDVVRDKSAKL